MRALINEGEQTIEPTKTPQLRVQMVSSKVAMQVSNTVPFGITEAVIQIK